MNFTRQIENNNKMASTIRHSLGYLPATLLKAIFEEKIILGKNEKFPINYTFKTCCIYLDISHFFQNGTAIPIPFNIKNKSSFNNIGKYINVPEFYYFFFNRYYEKIISIITNHGGDLIFEGLGVYAIWPPEVSESDNYKFNKMEEINMINSLYLKSIQCALDLQKKTIKSDLPNSPSFCPKIGISVGNCKFIILKGIDGKYEYAVIGDALLNSYDCAEHCNKKGQILTNSKMFDNISNILDFSFLEENNKYIIINGIKNNELLLQNNKSTVNIIRNNFTLEQIIKKRDVLIKFHSYLSTDIFQRPILSEKWSKEIIYLTLLCLRFKMNQKDSEDPNKLQEIYQIIQQIVFKLGGTIHKIITDGGGFIFQIAFGIVQSFSSQHEVMGVLAAFEICLKLKKINVFPFIGISTGLSFYGLIGTIGGRREISIISSLIFLGLLCMQKAETMYGDKRYGADDNILIDESTMLMIDSKIPCKFWQKANSKFGIDINLFVPLKIENLLHKHTENNLFPLIGTHLHTKDGNEYQLDEEIVKEDDIIYFEDEKMKDMVKLLNNYTNNKTRVKLINISSLTGCGKTLLLKRCLDTFFQMNNKLKEILCNTNYGYNYPFIFNGNLLFVIDSEILIKNNNNDFRGIQLILKDIYEILYSEDNGKEKINDIITRNGCQDYVNYLKKIFNIQSDNDNENENEEEEDEEESDEKDSGNKKKKNSTKNNKANTSKKAVNNQNNDTLVLTSKIKEKINLFFIDLIKEYKNFINEIFKETLSLYNISIPIILIIEDLNTCDDLTKDFINFYLQRESNDFLILTANSIPLYPPFVYLNAYEKDPFYDFKDNPSIKKYELYLYDSEEKISRFVQSILYELRKIRITSVSKNILKFLLNKTFGGNPQFIMKLIINIYDQNLLNIVQEKLIETKKFAQMLKFNDFTELNIPNIMEKKIGEIINKELDAEEVCLLKIASLLGDLFDLTRLKQVIIIDSSSNFVNSLKNGEELCLYKKLCNLESKYIIEILEDLDIKHKFVICKFAIPFLREILYKRIPSEQRNQLHYIIGKMIKVSFSSRGYKKNKYMSDEMEIEMLKNHLKHSEIAIHENFLKGNIVNDELTNDNLNINNLKTLIIQQICAKISSIKINDDKNNMIKAGYIYKKSDGKLTWENRFFVLTTNRVVYYYNKEDYKKDEKAPLGIFYLQNLFSVNLLTDGSIGGKKNIFSLSVNEWIKKGNFMTQRIYYLSIEDREELYKWMITFNILKIKAFYDNYCLSFGFVNFPLYDRNKNEIIVKPNNVKFDIEDYKEKRDIEKNELRASLKKKKHAKRMSIFNPYFIIGDKETKMEDIEHENFLMNQLLCYFKFVLKYTLSIFLGNIQMTFKKTNYQFINKIKFTFSRYMNRKIDLATPIYILSMEPICLSNEINILTNNILSRTRRENEKKLNSIYVNSMKSEFTRQEENYFNQYYKDFFDPKINRVNFSIVSNKKLSSYKKNARGPLTLFTKEDIITMKEKLEWEQYLENDNESFKYCDEEKIDNNDFLRYTDYIEKLDNNGSNKEIQRPSYFFRNSISTKINTDFNNNGHNGPILDNLINRGKNLEGGGSQLFNNNEFKVFTEDNKNRRNSSIDTKNIKNKSSKKKNKKRKSKSKKKQKSKEKKKEQKEIESKKEKEKKSEVDKTEKEKEKGSKKMKESEKKKEKGSEKKENEKKKEKEKNKEDSKDLSHIKLIPELPTGGSNLYSMVSEEGSDDNDKRKNINSLFKTKGSKENWIDISHKSTEKDMNNYDLANEIRKSGLNNKKVVKSSFKNQNEKNKSISEKSDEESLYSNVEENNEKEKEKVKIKDKDKDTKGSLAIESVNENFSFGESQKRDKKSKEQSKKNWDKEDKENSSTKDQVKIEIIELEKHSDSSIINTSKSEENKNHTTNNNNTTTNNDNNNTNNNTSENNININETSKVKKNDISKSDVDSLKKENSEHAENENTEVLSFKDKLNEFVNNEDLLSSKTNKDNDSKNGNEGVSSNQSNDKKNQQNNIKTMNTINSLKNFFNINNQLHPKKKEEYIYLKEINLNQKYLIDEKVKERNKSNNPANKTNESIQNSERKSLDSDIFNQLKNINISLDNEKNYINSFKKINREILSCNTIKEVNTMSINKMNTKSKKSTKYSQEMTSGSTNSNLENFYYPDVYYINEENNLHTKTHISMIFTKLKNRNNNS